jgi:hypothetical protein
MVQFRVTAEADAARCREAMRTREPVSVTGAFEGQLVVFTGVVLAVEDDAFLGSVAWLVTMNCSEMTPVVTKRHRSG